MNLNNLLKEYLDDNYEYANAVSKVCQDVIFVNFLIIYPYNFKIKLSHLNAKMMLNYLI